MSEVKMVKSGSPREIYVRVIDSIPNRYTRFDVSKIKEEYDREGGEMTGLNVFSGGSIGATIGIIACLASTALGVPISSPEVIVMVCGSLIFGVVAGFVLF